ncbi:ABC transporter [Nocardia farcinica]|nr:ABC transporter [Nocardia farcinica]
MTSCAIDVRSMTVAYGPTTVLHEVSLQVPREAITAVVGPSGSGKTTFLRAIAGLESIRSGTIEIGGVQVAGGAVDLPPHTRSIGLVPQEGALFGHLTVAGNIGFGLGPWWRRRTGRAARITELLEVIEMEEYRRRRPSTLSGGQRQRVALARALAPRPTVIALDEPFSALDADLRVRLRTHVRNTLLSERATGLLVTHDREEALAMADHIVVLIGGKVRQVGPPQEIYIEPSDSDVARLFGEATIIEATASGGHAASSIGAVKLRKGAKGRGHLVIRPRDLETVSDPRGSSDVVGSARVVAVRNRGDDVLQVARTASGDEVLLACDPDQQAAVGQLVSYRQRRPVHFISATH